MASDELSKKLNRRNEINEGGETSALPSMNVWNPYTEFKEFSRKQIQDFQKTFNKWVIEMLNICHVFFKVTLFVFYGVGGQSLAGVDDRISLIVTTLTIWIWSFKHV